MQYNEPCYVISVAAKLVGMHVQTLRYYERAGLISPSRSRGNVRMFSEGDLHRVRARDVIARRSVESLRAGFARGLQRSGRG